MDISDYIEANEDSELFYTDVSNMSIGIISDDKTINVAIV